MDSVTDLKTDEVPASEPWFSVMDPISLDVCENDLQKWSIQKKNEEYLAIHQDGPFPLPDAQPLSSPQVRDSICLYRDRMIKHHQNNQETRKTSSKMARFNLTSFANITPSTKHLSQQLRAYRQKLNGKSDEQTRTSLSNLEAELTATIEVVHQKLSRQNITTSTNSPPSKRNLRSRASDLSQKAAKKVKKTFHTSIRRTASEHNATHRPKIVSRTSWPSATTSKLADKVRTLVKKSSQPTRENCTQSVVTNSSINSVYTESSTNSDHQDTQHSPVIFGKLSWKKSTTSSMASIKTLRSRLRSRTSSKSSTPPSPRSKSHHNSNHIQEHQHQSFERREWRISGDSWPGVTADDPQNRQRTGNRDAESQKENSGCDVRRMGLEVQRPTGFEYEGYMGWKDRKTSVACSASMYSRPLSG